MLRWLKSLLKAAGILACLVGLSLGMVFLTLRILVPPQRIEVPSVVGKEMMKALALLGEQDLSLKLMGEKYSSQAPEGIIISQFPAPGTKVHKDREIRVFVSGGARLVITPSLVGKRKREANIYLAQRGLRIGIVSYSYTQIPQEEIISQDPSPQTETDVEKGINILVSLGAKNLQFYMPDFVGSKIEEVRELCDKLSLKIGKIKESPSLGEEGAVLYQSVSPGTVVDSETPIELTVSTFYEQEHSLSPEAEWIMTTVEVPPGLMNKEVRVVIIDSRGERGMDYGQRKPGEKVLIVSRVVGKGEIKVYIDNKLVKTEKVE